jgi:hypothetical protein
MVNNIQTDQKKIRFSPERDYLFFSTFKKKLLTKVPDSRRKTSSKYFLVIFLLLPALLVAQNNSSRIERLRGGILGMKIKWSGEAFSGLGARADAMGGSISTLYSGAENLSWNPAGLGFSQGFHVTLDWSPPLTIDPGGILGIEKKINNSLMETAQNNSPGGIVAPGTVEDAVVNSELDMRGGLKGGALMYGNSMFTVAASFYEPLRIDTQMSMSGIEFKASALDDQGDVTHRIFGTMNGNFNLEMVFFTTSVGFGTRITPNFSVGMAYDNFNGEMNFEGTFLPEGIISTRNDEAFFNDPKRTQYDSLFATIKGDWEGSGFRFRWGLGYHPNPDLSLDAVIALPSTIGLSGPFKMIHNNIRALNLGAEGDEEVFNVDILVEDNLTKTEKRITRVPGIEFEMPGSVALGFSTRWDHFLASVVYTKYFDHLGYKLSYDQFDSVNVKIKGGDIHQGISLGSAFRVGIGVEQLILGVGVVFGETFKEELKDSNPEPEVSEKNQIFLPIFSLGGGFRLGSRFRLDYVVSPYNSSFLRVSTSYRL